MRYENVNYQETPEGDIIPDYRAGHGNQPGYPGGDDMQPDYFYDKGASTEYYQNEPDPYKTPSQIEDRTPEPVRCGDCGASGGCIHLGFRSNGTGYTKGN